jgi:flavodoxin
LKAVVIYDSEFGNTERVAKTIGSTLGTPEQVQVKRVGEVNTVDLRGVNLIIVGSPTQRFRPTPVTKDFLERIPANGLQGIRAAAFDTRLTDKEFETTRIGSFFVGIFGYAAQPIANQLKKKGAALVAAPEGFYVQGVEGPLAEGELERAADWAKQVAGMA